MTDAPKPIDAATAREVATSVTRLLTELAAVMQHETAAVRAGRLRDAAEFEARKSQLAAGYYGAAMQIKAHAREMKRLAPEMMRELEAAAACLQPVMQFNLTVLATAHAVAEGLVRGVAGEVAKQTQPTTYGRSGRASAPPPRKAEPIALVRTL